MGSGDPCAPSVGKKHQRSLGEPMTLQQSIRLLVRLCVVVFFLTACADIRSAGAESAEAWLDAATYASGLRVPAAVGDFLILRALRESGGTAVAVPDHEMAEWVHHMGADTGVFAAPEGGAVAAAARRAGCTGIRSCGCRP